MSFGSFLTGLVIGGAAVYGSLGWHVLRTDEGFEVVAKTQGTFAETYLDVRNYTLSDWASHKTLSAAIVQAKKERIFQSATMRSATGGVQSMAQSFGSWGPGTQTR